ncbi:MAG: FRG domain-containing protein [Desulfobaccales bacterium]
MQEIDLNSWEEFEERIKGLENERRNQEPSSEFLYRGQGRKSWELLTTLERHGKKNLSFRDYFRLISIAKPQIESFTGSNWNIPSWPDGFDKLLKENKGSILLGNILNRSDDLISYMVDLRHHGFPSPLLDWSSSHYVAAYLAFNDVLQREEAVSIFVYCESITEYGEKWIGGDKPWIYRPEPYAKIAKRHYNQYSHYTVCVILDQKPDGEWKYAPHSKVFARNDPNQDVLWKFNIPFSERLNVLKQLDKNNINALSLFGSKESLMETMALREIYFRDREPQPPL